MSKIIIAYVPVLHRGYPEFFDRHRDAAGLCLIPTGVAEELEPALKKDVRAISSVDMHAILCGVRGFPLFGSLTPLIVEIAGEERLKAIAKAGSTVIMPDEELSRAFAAKYLLGCEVTYDSVFLRWERRSVLAEQEVKCDRVVPFEGFVGEMMSLAYAEAAKGSNWWRRVGAVIARDGEVILVAHNRQVPSPHTPYVEGDPRMFFKRGILIELTTDHHAEARLVSEAARRKEIALDGCDLYVTVFPCPPCAKLIAYSGIRRCFFAEGYSMLDGERILRENDVEIIRVELKTPTP